MKNFLLRGLLALAFAAACTTQALADDADILREAHARAQIEDLMWRYVRALDSFDPEAYASVYTEDGQFGSGANATQ